MYRMWTTVFFIHSQHDFNLMLLIPHADIAFLAGSTSILGVKVSEMSAALSLLLKNAVVLFDDIMFVSLR